MPLIVDKEKEKKKILDAFEKCLEEKPVFLVSLRDIAKKANMTHPKLLNYFKNKDDLVLAYCDYIKNFMSIHCKEWFETHNPNNYKDKNSYMNAFMKYVANGKKGEKRPVATVQTYVLAKYNNDVKKMIQEEFSSWKNIMKECLIKVYGDEVSDNDSEYLMILISGVFICKYNDVLSGNINDSLINSSSLFKK